MSKNLDLIMLLSYNAPAVSSLLSVTYLWLAKKWKPRTPDRKLRNILTLFFLAETFNWAMVSVGLFAPQMPALVETFRFGMLLAVHVMLYHFVYMLTADQDDRRFSPWHYTFPVAMFLFTSVLSLVVSPEGRVYSEHIDVYLDSGRPAEFYYYSILFYTFHIRVVYSLTYTLLGIRRVVRYEKKVVHYSADMGNTSMGWVLLFLLLSLPLLVTSMVVAIVTPYQSLISLWSALPAIFVFQQMPIMCFFVVSRRYVLMSDLTDSSQEKRLVRENRITTEKLEEYMLRERPYRNTALKITDMTVPLKTNRKYLSSFINKTYGVNFSQFINGYRLRELEALIADPENDGRDNLELMHQVGFGSYHSYYRTKKQQDKQTLLSI